MPASLFVRRPRAGPRALRGGHHRFLYLALRVSYWEKLRRLASNRPPTRKIFFFCSHPFIHSASTAPQRSYLAKQKEKTAARNENCYASEPRAPYTPVEGCHTTYGRWLVRRKHLITEVSVRRRKRATPARWRLQLTPSSEEATLKRGSWSPPDTTCCRTLARAEQVAGNEAHAKKASGQSPLSELWSSSHATQTRKPTCKISKLPNEPWPHHAALARCRLPTRQQLLKSRKTNGTNRLSPPKTSVRD